jgi:hypothetical protein
MSKVERPGRRISALAARVGELEAREERLQGREKYYHLISGLVSERSCA